MIEQHASGPARRDAGRGVGPSIVMAAGLGWVGGNYHWPGPQRFEQVLIHPQGFGPRGFLDWVPIGMANAGGGLWLKTIRRRHPVGTTPPPSDWADVRDRWHHLRTA